MARKPRLLDLFCGAGGAAKGYQRAGFYVVGVDIEDQPRYRGDEFFLADALALVRDRLNGCWHESSAKSALPGRLAACLGHFDVIHASPPCHANSALRHLWKDRAYPDLIAPTRDLLVESGLPYVIENTPDAAVKLIAPVVLCGSSFGLGAGGRQLRRHRLFETNWPLLVPPCAHRGQPVGVYGHGGGGSMKRGYKGTGPEYQEAMGMPGHTKAEIAKAIPPAYTELIGHQLMQHLRATGADLSSTAPARNRPQAPQ